MDNYSENFNMFIDDCIEITKLINIYFSDSFDLISLIASSI